MLERKLLPATIRLWHIGWEDSGIEQARIANFIPNVTDKPAAEAMQAA